MNTMKLRYFLILLIFGLSSCNKVETHNSLNKETIDLIRSLRLLNNDEKIIRFYSNYQPDLAGNFYTNKRIAHYWLDKHDKEKSDTTYAFYQDIISIDTVFRVPDTFSPYLLIKTNKNSEFKVYIEGNRKSMIWVLLRSGRQNDNN
jgi:hypothetical protein